MPCEQCDGKRPCCASILEIVARAKAVMKGIINAEYVHSDYAKYSLHLQSCNYAGKALLFRTEIKDIYNRIAAVDEQYGVVPMPTEIFMKTLPGQLREMVNYSTCYKIESMDKDGSYQSFTNDAYSRNFISSGGIMAYAKKHHLPPKLVDFVGACEHDAHYKMWVESLLYPGQIMIYKGYCIWRANKEMVLTQIFMASMIVSFSQIVTVTSVQRCS
jgi:hypothetical protein